MNNHSIISIRIDDELRGVLDSYCQYHRMGLSSLIRSLIVDFLESSGQLSSPLLVEGSDAIAIYGSKSSSKVK